MNRWLFIGGPNHGTYMFVPDSLTGHVLIQPPLSDDFNDEIPAPVIYYEHRLGLDDDENHAHYGHRIFVLSSLSLAQAEELLKQWLLNRFIKESGTRTYRRPIRSKGE